MRTKLLFTILVLLIVLPLSAQTVIWQEDFETDGNGSRYTSSNEFHEPGNDDDYFGRVYGPSLEYGTSGSGELINIVSNVSGYAGYSGDYYMAGEDLDDIGAHLGDGLDEKIVTFNPVDISNATGLNFKGLFAAGENDPCSMSAYDSVDYIRVYYNVDGGGDVLALQFSPDIECNIPADITNEPLHNDPNLDGDGGEGTLLTFNMQEFSFGFPDGNSVVIRVEIHMDAADEEIAFDDLRIEADTVLGLSDSILEQSISIYPNPSNGIFKLKKVSQLNLSRATLYDMLGKNVKSFDLTNIAETITMDLSDLNSGIYMIRINTSDQRHVIKKIIIE